VVETCYVCAEDSRFVYGGATALVFASWYEGFGLPVLEAFACGTPVIASRVASLPEVAGDAAAYVDPAKPEEIAAVMSELAGDESKRRELAAKGAERVKNYSWEKTSELTWQALDKALSDTP